MEEYMNAVSLPRVGDTLFLEQYEVMVTKVFTCFHIVEICRSGMSSKLYVDADALSPVPDCTFSISLRYFGRGSDE
jgi:hypothetical protein